MAGAFLAGAFAAAFFAGTFFAAAAASFAAAASSRFAGSFAFVVAYQPTCTGSFWPLRNQRMTIGTLAARYRPSCGQRRSDSSAISRIARSSSFVSSVMSNWMTSNFGCRCRSKKKPRMSISERIDVLRSAYWKPKSLATTRIVIDVQPASAASCRCTGVQPRDWPRRMGGSPMSKPWGSSSRIELWPSMNASTSICS